MEAHLLSLLSGTLQSHTETIRNSEAGLTRLYSNHDLPITLLSIAERNEFGIGERKAALTTLKNYVTATWASDDDSPVDMQPLPLQTKVATRWRSFALATDATTIQGDLDHSLQALAANVVRAIGSVDFPEAWPELLPEVLRVLNESNHPSGLLGAMRIVQELVDDGFTDADFNLSVHSLLRATHRVATADQLKLQIRAIAVSVFRSCWDMLETSDIMQRDVKIILGEWMHFFQHVISSSLPPMPTQEDETSKSDVFVQWKGTIALKLQVVKTLEKIKEVRASALSSYSVAIFEVVWGELSRLTVPYQQLLVEDDRGSKEIDSDGLPHTIDYLVIEELDLLNTLFQAPPVKKELDVLLRDGASAPWLQELIGLLVQYTQIPAEEETFWEADANLYLCESTSLSPNYNPRAACADLLTQGLAENLRKTIATAVVFHWQSKSAISSAKQLEAMIFLLTVLVRDLEQLNQKLDRDTICAICDQMRVALFSHNHFLRAGARLMFGAVFEVAPDLLVSEHSEAENYLHTTVTASLNDEAEIVKVACFRAIQDYLRILPQERKLTAQTEIVDAVGEYLSAHDIAEEAEDADDILSTLTETLRDAIAIDPVRALDNTQAVTLFINLAAAASGNYNLFTLSTEAFESLVEGVVTSSQPDAFVRLCSKTIPAVSGAFDVADVTKESSYLNLAAELLAALAQHGADPLPEGFVAAIMPKLSRILMAATEPGLVRPATIAVRYMLQKASAQYLTWSDPVTHKSAIEVTLLIIDRLLRLPEIEEDAADEVGGLALELVTKAGAERLGGYLMELLRALAIRLAPAERPQFVQSLLMVFANLAIVAAKEVIDFLSEVQIEGQSGLAVVLPKWLDKSIEFAGFEEIRQNITGLSKIYSLDDPRVKAIGVKGELIVENTVRIKTRSQAKKNPDRYTAIPANVKILQILASELTSATKYDNGIIAQGKAAADALDELDSDDGEDGGDGGDWEDVGTPGVLDLASLVAKENLMGDHGQMTPTNERSGTDDETTAYLINWFREESTKPYFQHDYGQLSEDDRQKLGSIG